MENLNLISQTFFGTKLDKTFKCVLITNIGPIFLGIIKRGVIIQKSKGFYQTFYIKIGKNFLRVIKATPGNVILDILKAIHSQVEKIFFIGLVGSLNKRDWIGKIVIPREAVNFTDLSHSIIFWDPDRHSLGKICQVNGLIQEKNFYVNLFHHKVEFVDMESCYLAAFGKENNKKVKFIGIVSDKPLSEPFYKVSGKVKVDYNKLLSLIR